LSVILGLDSKQVYYTCAFLHAPVTEDVYVHMPRGFEEDRKVLKLQSSLYGSRQSPRNFFKNLKENLIKVGFTQSRADPCLFMSENVICLVYLDYTLFYSPNETDIDIVLEKLRKLKMELKLEYYLAGFLGLVIKKLDRNRIKLTQTGLIKRICRSKGKLKEKTQKQHQQRQEDCQKIYLELLQSHHLTM